MDPTITSLVKSQSLSPAQKRALRVLIEGGGGVVDQYGRLVCAGEVHKFDPATLLRLVAIEMVSGMAGRLLPTEFGIKVYGRLGDFG